ncbi:MAG: serine/threonine protein kinase, partial [Phycisphaerales bacterium]|nr:serine/threonine protein kinase [Phycisphaerales bacterium]
MTTGDVPPTMPFEPDGSDPDALIGERVGAYRLDEIVGRGGFGVVYRAEQLEPVRRTVAFKVIRPGMDSSQVVRRFEAERQALALMNHDHVAKVFDAGTTPRGRPYVVMEYVDGRPLTRHCDEDSLSIDDRLRLFIEVCDAIQHAHAKGIVHRDIKPNNVLVREDGVVKVIDFGIAKALEQKLTDETIATGPGQLIGTPEYMSPEQVDLHATDVDTRSDVYALGVLLYELLTGTLPFDAESLRVASLAEIQRIIREVDPPKPSTRLSSIDDDDEVQRLARSRRVDRGAFRRVLQGDLDW